MGSPSKSARFLPKWRPFAERLDTFPRKLQGIEINYMAYPTDK